MYIFSLLVDLFVVSLWETGHGDCLSNKACAFVCRGVFVRASGCTVRVSHAITDIDTATIFRIKCIAVVDCLPLQAILFDSEHANRTSHVVSATVGGDRQHLSSSMHHHTIITPSSHHWPYR
jgi:hypothetical protein